MSKGHDMERSIESFVSKCHQYSALSEQRGRTYIENTASRPQMVKELVFVGAIGGVAYRGSLSAKLKKNEFRT
ncbi:hypothetical protein KIN20_024586 [Parelaphostrongylus tenuis]|uniref:Uncharacterized protein n=1 Tax=Parelaphostrongylus tenuis TaxID=148309 RepID=A0AAD5QWU4_PARTN|nr:hypothetical protein KIN20_024586 [Parelaphostrongylus tenuis]